MKIFKISNIVYKKALVVMVGISLIMPHSTNAFGGELVFDPTTYASILESIEKYNTMIKNMQDTLDVMNRVNDIMNTASNQLNNLQTGLADPRQLVSRFESNLKGIEDNAKRISKNLEEKDWANAFHKKEYASCKTKWQNLLKEYKEYEKQTAQDNLGKAMSENDGSEESEQRLEEARQAFNKSHEARAIERGFEYIDTFDTQGLQAATNKMHEWANAAQKYIDVRNSEYISIEEAMRPKDRYTYQKKLCNMVDKEMAKLKKMEGMSCYQKAVANKNRKGAEECIKIIKEANADEYEYRRKDRKYNEISKRAESGNIFKIQSENINRLYLHIDANNGNLSGDWKTLTGKDKVIREEVAQSQDITIGSGDNQSTMKVWFATQDIINQAFESNYYADALSLQNERNMALAMGSDTYALTQAQAETLMMISKQIVLLNDSVNAIGQIAESFIMAEKESFKKAEQESQKHNTRDELKRFSIDDEVKHWEYNEYGIPVFKNRNFEDKGILGL